MKARFEELELNSSKPGSYSSEANLVGSITFGSSNRRKKYLIAASVLVGLVVIALAIGLGVGLRKASDAHSEAEKGNVEGTTAKLPTSTPTPGKPYQPVVLISLDGFRASYLDYDVTPNIKQLIKEGVHTPRMLAAYPTLTFPNHYTLVTGLYPESHGIVDNKMFDINLGRMYQLGRPETLNPDWYSGEPLWLTVKRHGKKSFCYFWVGSEVPINGEYADKWRKYNGSVPFNERVDTVLGWLSLPADSRPDLITLYFNEPDHIGHAQGPGPGPEMLDVLRMVDGVVGQLVSGLKDRGLYDDVNMVIVSDHGMSARSCLRQVTLKTYFNTKELANMYVYTSASGRISNRYIYSRRRYYVLDKPRVSTEEILRKASSHPSMALYNKANLPRRLHYANNIRIDDVIIKMEDEWVVSRNKASGQSCSGGTHGWDSRYESMSALFIGHGPAFKVGVEVPPFENIELYSLLSDVLNVTAAPNNGTRGALYNLLKNPPELEKLAKGDSGHCQPLSDVSTSPDLQNLCNCSTALHTDTGSQPSGQGIVQPVSSPSQSELCLSDDSHVTVYSTRLHMPLWTSFTISREEDIRQDSPTCFVPEDKLPAEEREMYRIYVNETSDVTSVPLFASDSNCGNIARTSDVLPMTERFKGDLWQELWTMVRGASNSTFPPIAVTVGPAFDYDYDGLADRADNITRYADNDSQIPLPSHYFVVLARCPQTGQSFEQCVNDLDLLSFLLPNEQNTNGQTAERRLLENVARLRDVELMTGLRFFPDLDPALSARLRTHVPMSLWTRPGSWKDDLCSATTPEQHCPSSYRPVVLVSLDGFRADYLAKYNRTPTIDKLIQCGVHAPYMRPVYPTKTYPNHHTILTGLYPESHGIIANKFYDIDLDKNFCWNCDHLMDTALWGGEPIWLTAQRQGRKTAMYFLPGTGVPIQGEVPNMYENDTQAFSLSDRVKTALQSLALPADQRPDLVTLYFREPDAEGHRVGPDSAELGEKLAAVDAALDELMHGLYHRDLHRCVNLIILSDHGMGSLSCERLVSLAADIPREDTGKMYVYDGPAGRISNRYRYGRSNNFPINPPQINISTIMDTLECRDAHMKVYSKATLPLRYHYTNNPRIDEILLVPDDEWVVSRAGYTNVCKEPGGHGWDNLYASMHALFVAHGPDFKSGLEVEPFENIELYNLLAGLLGVTPAPNNGTEGALHSMLRSPPILHRAQHAPVRSCSQDAAGTELQDQCSCTTTTDATGASRVFPLGLPVVPPGGRNVCVTNRSDSTVGYDFVMASPAWAAFTVNVTNSSEALSVMSSTAPCVARDSWMSPAAPVASSTSLEGTDFVPGSLVFGQGAHCNAAMASEVVPMIAEFRSGIWREVEEMVAEYSAKFGQIAVTVGPVYNDEPTGLWRGRTNNTRFVNGSIPVPSHIFVVLGKCASIQQSMPCRDSLELLSFIIPHVAMTTNCQSFSDMLRDNVARLRDVELATGLRFFPELPENQSARLTTFLPSTLWPGSKTAVRTPKPGRWIEQACPPKDKADRQCPNDYQPVLLVSMDGFKPQYLGRGMTPVIDRLVSCGVHAPYMRSVYPTKTFPNHYTIVTGLYPESHGIIDNNMFDFNLTTDKFKINSDTKNEPEWWGGEPIWITGRKQNVSSASYFWVGSDVAIDGIYPNIVKYYSGSVPYSSRVSTVVEWMRLPEARRPELLMLYFDEPDHKAHSKGPFTPEVDMQVQRVDGIIGELMDSLYQHDLHHCVNLVLVSDHGFSATSCDKVVELNDYFTEAEKNDLYFYLGPFGRISNTYASLRNRSVVVFRDGNEPMSVAEVQNHLQCVPNMKVYAKTDLPTRHHYANNDRIDNIILDPAINWTVAEKMQKNYCTGGSHGWDNTYKAMEALFVGYGPAFKNGETVEAFENIELYNMISDLLGVQPASNNGTVGSLDHLLWQTFNRTRDPVSSYVALPASFDVTVTTTCNCTLEPGTSLANITQALGSLVTSEMNQNSLPFGAPLLMTSERDAVMLLHQPTFITAFGSSWGLPVWISASVSTSMLKTAGSPAYSCAVEDPRVADDRNRNAVCENLQRKSDNVTYVSLLPSAYNLGAASSLLSSRVPMRTAFYTGLWKTLQTYLGNWSTGYQELNVISGPAFDTNNDGVADTLEEAHRLNNVSSHIFVIASRCRNRTQSFAGCSSIQTLSFILPQVDTSKQFNCQTDLEYLIDNEARVRDVELITGLHFFKDLPFSQAVAMRTYLPSGLWPL